MIEVIYQDEKQGAKGGDGGFSIPRNIRQIGLIGGNSRIYMEDYVYTFLVRLSDAEPARRGSACALAVLTGEVRWNEGTSYLFIKGALLAEGTEAAVDHIDFSPQVWEKIHEEQKESFPHQEVVGWFFSAQQLPMEASELFTKVHLRDFGGEKVLMLMEPAEREEAFFRYENGSMVRQSGYYIYYEKNPLMQEYMLKEGQRLKQAPAEVIEDEAVKAFRKMIRNKKEVGKKEEEKEERTEEAGTHGSLFSYAATACMVLAVLAVGGSFYRNYQILREAKEQEAASRAVVQELVLSPSAYPQREAAEVTQIPEETPVPSVVPAEEQTVSEGAVEESSRYYREESDARKAKRREALAQREEQEASSEQEALEETIDAPEPSKAGETPAPEPTPSQESRSAALTGESVRETYVIRPGDTLYQISVAKYGTMDQISQICLLNGLTENQTIYPGQVIVLP
ncbi:MAG: LysM peptidoglycan-binding domain-containing protein [Eubacteriales bacterium]|nr:LysM peptidoglycan-binding domain-containing protein [Eubacteriales bacterium]